jgi:valyl-tRNA synthetase
MEKSRFDRPYDPHGVEERWYSWWEERGFFHADETQDNPNRFCIVIPPPNITGSLHIGHALNNTLQDILIRWKRMQGYNTLWMPGTDHAGIATQNVVERQLLDSGTDREKVGRTEFIKRIRKWREESGRAIITQLKRLGASCDWAREQFTMDEGPSAAVREVFVRLYEEGLIYRGERLINWCPRCHTALSDIEVEHEDVLGKMYYIKYPLADQPDKFLTVATTRPETMLGDTAVAVHPDDPRYNQLIGEQVLLPLTHRKIPVVGDSILVDREFGTGAVKITPAHDFNDEKAGHRHRLPFISILNEKSQIQPMIEKVDHDILGKITLLEAFKARAHVVKFLDHRGHLLKVEDHKHAIGKCYRCKTVVEPYLSPQWFVKVNDSKNSLAAPAIEAVRSGRIRMVPEGWKNNYFGWMENIEDWCISRQIWWGHQIPAWYCNKCNLDSMLQTTPNGTPVIGVAATPTVSRSAPVRCDRCGNAELTQDPDVLDTWFSSALWPFSTLGWPGKTQELKTYYPTSVLVTSFDILFFWVSRMIMMGLHFMMEIPFRDVYIHALVRDVKGQKMSKSKGNVIDPLIMMEKYGTDAVRFTLASMASPGRDLKLSEERMEGYRNFANKIWNAARFLHLHYKEPGELLTSKTVLDDETHTPADRWITTRMAVLISSVNEALGRYRFDEACRSLYQFTWHEFCDWYLELIKPILSDIKHPARQRTLTTLVETYETLLRLLHPFMPFITEEIWQSLPHERETILLASYPEPEAISVEDKEAANNMDRIIDIITKIRIFRNELNVPTTQPLRVGLITWKETLDRINRHHLEKDICRLARLSDFIAGTTMSGKDFPSGSPALQTQGGEVWIDSKSLKGIDLRKQQALLEKKMSAVKKELATLDSKRKNQEFLAKAPPEVVDKNNDRANKLNEESLKLSRQLSLIAGLLAERSS